MTTKSGGVNMPVVQGEVLFQTMTLEGWSFGGRNFLILGNMAQAAVPLRRVLGRNLQRRQSGARWGTVPQVIASQLQTRSS